MDQFDVVVIGSGPAGQKAAIAAAKLGKRAAIVERKHMMGGVCINTGTIPSKTLREAVLYLTGLNQRELYGDSYRLKSDITVTDLAARTDHVVSREIDVIQHQLARNSVTMFVGSASFVGPNEITVEDVNSVLERDVTPSTKAPPALPLFNQPLREAREAFERLYFEHHLKGENGNMTRIADKTGLERTHLYRKLKQLGLSTGRRSEEHEA